mmetsp:Transcript_11255/g.31144  ORF Transcript_11255/g.31144 Transcript_11255/m.31144 type:complete len:281 (-) Transcript_11255:31-873(-)
MQLLVPPIFDDDENDSDEHGLRQGSRGDGRVSAGHHATDRPNHRPPSPRQPQQQQQQQPGLEGGVRNQAQIVPIILHDAADATDNGSSSSNNGVLPPSLREDFEAMKAMLRQSARESNQMDDEEHAASRRKEKATDIAIAIHDEVHRLRNGIAELEAMLDEASQSSNSSSSDSVNSTSLHHDEDEYPAEMRASASLSQSNGSEGMDIQESELPSPQPNNGRRVEHPHALAMNIHQRHNLQRRPANHHRQHQDVVVFPALPIVVPTDTSDPDDDNVSADKS